jgi:hypothetical protein
MDAFLYSLFQKKKIKFTHFDATYFIDTFSEEGVCTGCQKSGDTGVKKRSGKSDGTMRDIPPSGMLCSLED